MELYDYECNIIATDNNEREIYFLEKTGKMNLSDIEAAILEKLDMCYIGKEKGGQTDIFDSLIRH